MLDLSKEMTVYPTLPMHLYQVTFTAFSKMVQQ
jgi:hypothetical protein